MQGAYQPLASVLQRRAELSKQFSALRRVRPCVPFWRLAAHRIPTLWTLYRGIMKHAPGSNIRWRMRMFFDQYKCWTSPKATREKLLLAYKYLDSFRSATEGDKRLQHVLRRYDSMIAAKRAKEEMKSMILEQMAWQERLRTRPIMTGAFFRPSVLNGPLPRLKPQPARISMMIRHRRLQYGRIGPRYEQLHENRNDLWLEKRFEEGLLVQERRSGSPVAFAPVFEDNLEWNRAIFDERTTIRESITRAAQRALTPYPPEMLKAIKEARREKIRNKTRERERERRGEVLRCTIERSRKRPPAHVLATMPVWKQRADKVVRGVSEVGYVGMMKSRMGVKMKNPNLWRELEGEDVHVEQEEKRKVREGVQENEQVNEHLNNANEERGK
ncbi:uncharacterized protein FOMMEDRAFT_103305 [Fomitiporia mediterranea MF3/22]|uniref:uncharacterized protein n=1 Tax=Fomitiporia mediterranea (strain MF3/22) TaxID=694068 RepID=UPI00044088A5|nr:uncharacterized protein FOMMEDRAFT_103305 [Fomitiporia mediterranea MF3/22]EJD05319.1 hypothetical protein FOMMEDRAFT_103305 [Fomitiporia mediterranea MF3/22]